MKLRTKTNLLRLALVGALCSGWAAAEDDDFQALIRLQTKVQEEILGEGRLNQIYDEGFKGFENVEPDVRNQMKRNFQSAVDAVFRSAVLSPEMNLDDAFRGVAGDEPSRRFAVVTKDGAFIGIMPEAKSDEPKAPKTSKFYCTFPIDPSPRYVLEYVPDRKERTERNISDFSFIGDTDLKDYSEVKMTRVSPKLLQPAVKPYAVKLLANLKHAYVNKSEPNGNRQLTREQYLGLLRQAAKVLPEDTDYQGKVADAIKDSEVKS